MFQAPERIRLQKLVELRASARLRTLLSHDPLQPCRSRVRQQTVKKEGTTRHSAGWRGTGPAHKLAHSLAAIRQLGGVFAIFLARLKAG
jgi:hypothetical protein